MKIIKPLITVCMFFSSIPLFAQSSKDAQAIKYLKDFYSIYNTVWSAPMAPGALADTLNSLRLKYCTVDFYVELMSDLDHDILINDQYTDVQHLKTLTVKKDLSFKDTYIVSYIAPTTSPVNKPIEKRVVIHVTTMIGARGIKIAGVCSQ